MSDASNAALIEKFYSSFGQRDAEAMVACYHPDVVFRDPAFGELHGDMACDMWRMLCRAGKDLQVSASDVHASGDTGSAHWEADYTFATKRKVHNVVEASFEFSDDLIINHRDDFSFSTWAGQAFGPVGGLFGRTPVMPFVMQRMARMQLDQFHKRRK